jgi:hypothetical protein
LIFSMNPSSWCRERLPDSSLRRSAISTMDRGSPSRALGLIWITQSSSGRVSTSSRTGGFWENRPSQKVPSPTGTARNRVGMAAEARTMSAVMGSRRLLNARNSPERTSTAPSSSIGPAGRPASRPKSTRRSSMRRNSCRPVTEVGVS